MTAWSKRFLPATLFSSANRVPPRPAARLCPPDRPRYPDRMMLLSCTGLTRGFHATPLFEDLAFELYNGERVGLVGPNGAGKTTLMRLLAGQDRPDAGDVRYH